MSKLDSLKQPVPLSKLAYDAILKSILSNKMRPDETYNEMALAKDLGISRTPVREALLELSVQGLVTFLPRKGIVVNRLTESDVDEIFEIRRAIEAAAVEKLASVDSPPDMRLLEEAIKRQSDAVKKNDYWEYLRADRDFHVILSQLTGNKRLAAIAENIRNLVHLMGTQAIEAPGRAGAVLAEHMRVLKSIKACDPEKARAAILDHLIKSERAVLDTFRHRGSKGPGRDERKAG